MFVVNDAGQRSWAMSNRLNLQNLYLQQQEGNQYSTITPVQYKNEDGPLGGRAADHRVGRRTPSALAVDASVVPADLHSDLKLTGG